MPIPWFINISFLVEQAKFSFNHNFFHFSCMDSLLQNYRDIQSGKKIFCYFQYFFLLIPIAQWYCACFYNTLCINSDQFWLNFFLQKHDPYLFEIVSLDEIILVKDWFYHCLLLFRYSRITVYFAVIRFYLCLKNYLK